MTGPRIALYCALLVATGCEGPPAARRLGALFAVIGDFGSDGPDERAVADQVDEARPDFVVSVGDNDYSSELGLTRSQATYERFVGAYYGRYLAPASGQSTRFWPAPGNHDWYVPVDIQPYLDYFPALPKSPANGRYYEVVVGDVHLFSLDSDEHEPDGNASSSVQAAWLQAALTASTACWKVVFFHHPPYSSGQPKRYFEPVMRWPFVAWGADLVLSGHEHFYERSMVDGIPYVISGLGGYSKFDFLTNPAPRESQARYNQQFGAVFVQTTEASLTLSFETVTHETIDRYSIQRSCPRR